MTPASKQKILPSGSYSLRGLVLDEPAQVEEELLVGLALGVRVVAPALDEFVGCQGSLSGKRDGRLQAGPKRSETCIHSLQGRLSYRFHISIASEAGRHRPPMLSRLLRRMAQGLRQPIVTRNPLL